MARPLGNLVSFGTYTFFPHRAIPLPRTDEVTAAYAPVVGRIFPIDRLGNAVQSLGTSTDGNQKVYEWHVVAQDYSPAPGKELLAVETQIAAMYALLTGTNGDGSSSAVGTLTQYNGDASQAYSTTARLVKIEEKELTWNYARVELTFVLRGDFT